MIHKLFSVLFVFLLGSLLSACQQFPSKSIPLENPIPSLSEASTYSSEVFFLKKNVVQGAKFKFSTSDSQLSPTSLVINKVYFSGLGKLCFTAVSVNQDKMVFCERTESVYQLFPAFIK